MVSTTNINAVPAKVSDGDEKFVVVDTGDTAGNPKTKLVASSEISKAGHTHTASEVTDFDTEVANNAAVTANTAKVTYPSADTTKLAGIEAGATADQTGAEIKAAYEAEADTNAFTDAEKTKLAGLGGTPKSRVLTYTFPIDDSTGSFSIAHGCSATPYTLLFNAYYADVPSGHLAGGSRGYDGTTATQKCYNEEDDTIDNDVVVWGYSGGSDECRFSVTSVDDTNIDVSRTYLGSFSSNNVNVIITCFF